MLAAEAAWTGGAEQPGAVPFDYRAEFARLWTKAALPATGAAGFTLDLRTMARTVVAGDGGTSVGSVGGSAAPRWGRFTFGDPAGAGTAVSAITLASKFGTGETSGESGTSARPSSLALDFSAGRPTTATAIQFAVAADHACPVGLPIATTTILFADGTSDTVTWKMSQTVFALDDARTAPLCPVLWKREPADPATQPPAVVHGYLWSNPKPGVALKGMRFDSLDRGPALMVFGVTGIQTPG